MKFFGNTCAPHLMLAVLTMATPFIHASEPVTAPVNEVKIWLSSWNNSTQKAEVNLLVLRQKPYSLSKEGSPGNIKFLSEENVEWLPEKIMGTGLYTAAYFACISRGKPWFASSWILKELPKAEWSDHEASLALALVASAEGKTLPEDVIIFGRLNPDRTLRDVDHIKERISAALKGGIKKFVLPLSQTVIADGDKDMINLASWIEAQGAECIRIKMLSDLNAYFLKSLQAIKAFAENPENKSEADPDLNRTFNELLGKTRKFLSEPLKLSGWLTEHQDEMKEYRDEAEEHFRLGIMAYQTGLTYTACEELKKSEALLTALKTLTGFTQVPEASLYETRTANLLKEIQDLKSSPTAEANMETSSGKALFFLETNDALEGLKDRIESTSNAVNKMKQSKSELQAKEKNGAILRWIFTVESVGKELKNLPIGVKTFWGSEEEVTVFEDEWRVSGFLDLASLAYADLTESFFYRIPDDSDEVSRAKLLHNAFFVATLRDARDNQLKNLAWYSGVPKDLVERREQNLVQGDFALGTGFSPYETLPLLATEKDQTPGNKVIILLNQYSRSVQTAYQMKSDKLYGLQMGVPSEQQGELLRLQSMAEEQARRSISNLKVMKINSNVPAIIYHRAFVLSKSRREEMKIESLRQYWRCTLISDALSVLSYTPTAGVAAAEPEQPEVESSQAGLPAQNTQP